ncbi:MAG: LysR family transcriptional regulator [Rhodospirillaceae bacterium]|nr:LysR family transcriptional regulator [Rhodospirillaceae bacterium]
MDQLTAMRTFRRVVEMSSFTAAARSLGLSKAAVSKQVGELEAHLGATLIHRTTRRLSATEVGNAYFERCVRLLDEFEAADAEVRHLQAEPTGSLRLSVPNAFGVTQMAATINELSQRYPKLRLIIEASDRFVDLIDEGFDAAIRIRTELPDSSLIARKLCTIPRYVCASPEYLERFGEPQRPEDLKSHNCLIYTQSPTPFDWGFRTAQGRKTVRVSGTMQSNHGLMLMDPLLAGRGIALLPLFTIEDVLKSGRVKRLLTDFPTDEVALHVVYPQNRHLSPKVRVLVDLMAEHFGRQPRWE